jgi:hypothetical protein
MFFRPICDKVKSLRTIVRKVERTRGAAPADVAELKRLLLSRIAELESKEAPPPSETQTSSTPRRAA